MLFLVNFELGNIVEILALAATTIGLLVSLYTARKDRKNNTQIQLLEERLKTYNDLCFMSKQLAMPIDIRLYQSKYIEDFNNKTNEIIKDLFLLNNKIRALFDEELYNWSKNLIVNIEKESSSITGFLKCDICKSVDVSDENMKKVVKEESEQEKKIRLLVHIIRDLAYLSGFEVIGRITFKDKKTGKEFN